MTRVAELQARIASIAELLEVVTAMRSLAAARVQLAERALPGIRHYAGIVAGAVARAESLVGATEGASPGDTPARLIVVCSEHGFVGPFNERLLDRAAGEPEASGGRLWIVGTRGGQLAQPRQLAVEWTLPMATHAAGVFDSARKLALEVEQRLARGELDRLAILCAHREAGETIVIGRRPLLPLATRSPDDAPPAVTPIHHVPPLVLLGRLIGEHLVGELSRVLMESFTSENAARLQAMEAARHNIEDKLGALREQANRARQDEITDELLDVITGAEAVRPRSS